MEQCEKMSASFYQILLLVMYCIEFENMKVNFFCLSLLKKIGQTLCVPDLPTIMNKRT